MTTYRRKQIEEITRIPARRIQFYTDQGLLPDVEKETGRGIERRYSEQDFNTLLIIREMADAGISLAQIKRFLKKIDELLAKQKTPAGIQYFICKKHKSKYSYDILSFEELQSGPGKGLFCGYYGSIIAVKINGF